MNLRQFSHGNQGSINGGSGMLARDLMQRRVVLIHEDDTVPELCDVFQQAHVHGAPVLDGEERLVGFVSTEDILFGSMGLPPEESETPSRRGPRARDIMTAPAVEADEETQVADLCRLMWRLRIHHVPIVREGKVTGIVSSLDLCRAIAQGDIQA